MAQGCVRDQSRSLLGQQGFDNGCFHRRLRIVIKIKSCAGDCSSGSKPLQNSLDERIKFVDLCMGRASVSLRKVSPADINLAHELCEHFELKLGTLMRRANAIRLLGEPGTMSDRLREAAQHLICK